MTNKQKELLKIVHSMKKHPTAEDVFNECKERGFNVSLASIYRILNELTEKGELKRIEGTSEKDVYDTFVEDHEHLVCTKCGRISDITIRDFKKILIKETNVDIESFDLVIRYVCDDCKAK